MDVYTQIAEKIIEQQEAIIGPVAVERAMQVKQLQINWPQHQIGLTGSPMTAIDELVEQYKELFGQIAVETCKDAVASFTSKLTPEQLPTSLK